MDIDDEIVKLLAELGCIAGGFGLGAQADAIVGALEVLRPGSERPYLIQALARMNVRDPGEAERILREQALITNPNSAMAKAFLGLSLHLQGRANERDQALNEAIALGDDEDAIAMAQHLLGASLPVG